ncbi:MAG: hypothetical protein NVSMB49_16580 [Ktedonobacteraceae bacterium]
MPPTCQAIQDQITTIEGEIQDLENELGGDVPPRIEAAILRQIRALNHQLTVLKQELAICLDPCSPIKAIIQTDENKIASLTGQISTVNTQIQTLTQQIAGLNAQLTSVQSDLQQQQQALAQCEAAHP